MGAGAIPLQVEKEFFDQAQGTYKLYVYTADVSLQLHTRVMIELMCPRMGDILFLCLLNRYSSTIDLEKQRHVNLKRPTLNS